MNKARTSKKFSLSYLGYCLAKLIVNIISRLLLFLPGIRRVTFIRQGGLGDCLMAAAVIKEWQQQHLQTRIKIVTNHPEVFNQLVPLRVTAKWSWCDWPMIHLLYEHYDWHLFRTGKNFSIKHIMAKQVGLKDSVLLSNLAITVTDSQFEQQYITEKNYLIIQPTAGQWLAERQWSSARWSDLIQYLAKDGWLIYQVGRSSDPLLPGVVDLRDISWPQLNQLFAHTKYFIGINSFAEQLAGVYQIPSLVIYGPTNPIYSLNQQQKAIFGNNQCVGYHQLSQLDYQFTSTDLVRPEFLYSCFIKLTTYT